MDWNTFVQAWIQRVLAALNGIKNNLVIAGVKASSITVEEVTTEGVNDLRYRITATRGNKLLVAYYELTSNGFINGQMAIVPTLYVEGNNGQITNTYSPGDPQQYNDPAAQQAVLDKLAVFENMSRGELLTQIRAYLGV
jgi:hypothetical protein